MHELKPACDQVLIDGLSPALKGSIDRLLDRGVNKAGILAFVRTSAERAAAGDPNKGKLTVLAVEAYLETR